MRWRGSDPESNSGSQCKLYARRQRHWQITRRFLLQIFLAFFWGLLEKANMTDFSNPAKDGKEWWRLVLSAVLAWCLSHALLCPQTCLGNIPKQHLFFTVQSHVFGRARLASPVIFRPEVEITRHDMHVHFAGLHGVAVCGYEPVSQQALSREI